MTRRMGVASWIGVAAAVAVVMAAAVPAEAQRWGRPRTPRAGACFYQRASFGGDYFCVEAGDEWDQMPEGLNDKVSSIRLFGDASVVVYRNPNFGGRSRRFTDDVDNLQNDGWNDTISSVRVRLDFGRGDSRGDGRASRSESRVSRPEAEAIVRRAYQNVLRRDPDPGGAQGFIDKVLRDRWSQGDVERELRKSPEYRNRPGQD